MISADMLPRLGGSLEFEADRSRIQERRAESADKSDALQTLRAPAESADHASAFGVRASLAPLSQGRLRFDGRQVQVSKGTLNLTRGRNSFGVPPSSGPNRLKPGHRTVGS